MIEHSKNFLKIKDYYENNLWSIEKVHAVVGKPLGITAEEFKEITGLDY